MSHQSEHFVPQDLLLELGRLTFYFQQLETVVRQAICRCFVDHPSGGARAALLIDGTPAGKLADKMLALYVDRFGEDDARVLEMTDLTREFNRLNAARNGFVHSSWLDVRLFEGAATRLLRTRAAVAQTQGVEEVPVAKVGAAADSCADLAHKLYYELLPKFGHAPGTE